MSLTAPFKIGLNTASTAIILTGSNNVTRILQRNSFVPTDVDGTTISITYNYLYDSKPQTIKAPFGDYRDLSNAPLGGSAYDTLVALSNLMGV